MADLKHKPFPSRPIRFGIVGCGEVTLAKHLPAIRAIKGVEIVAAADVDQNRRRQVTRQFGIHRTCVTIEELLRTPDLDAVGVCTPPATHARIAIAAMRAGKHVWVDKPLALNEDECVQMIDAAAEARTVTMTGLHMRFHRLAMAARRAIRRGELGRIESVRVAWHSPRSDLDIPQWRTVRSTGGGGLVEIAPHHLDLLRFLLNTEIAEIFAITSNDVREDENAVISARMSDGVVVSGEFSERGPHEMQIVISGSAAILTLDCLKFEGFNLRAIRQVPGAPAYRAREAWNFARALPAGLNIMRRGGDYRISYYNAWSAFFGAIRGKRVRLPTLEDGLRATQAVCAALQSREQRYAIAVPPPRAVPRPAIANVIAPSSQSRVFSVVVPTFNRPAQLGQLLHALARQRLASSDFEVIVVDDGGSEPLEPIVSPLRQRLQIRLLRQANQGCAAARQFGIDAARGEFLAFTDDDCQPGVEWLSSLHAALLRNPASAVAGPTLNALHKDLCAETTQLIVNWLTLANADSDGWVRYGPTCNLAFPAKEFKRVGGLDRTWRLAGGEDRDLSARWREAGLGIYFEPQAQVMHHHPLTTRKLLRQHFNYGRSARRFRRCAPDRGGFRSYLNVFGYARLLLLPWQNYQGLVSAKIAAYLALAQTANAGGLLVEICDLRKRVASFDDMTHAFPTQGSPQ